jgi:hypothetical protein
MTSEVQQRQWEATPISERRAPTCLCCCHFAVDLESMPEALGHRRARLPKKKQLATATVV